MLKQTPKAATARRPAGSAAPQQSNPFCFEGPGHMALSQTIANVQDGLRFLIGTIPDDPSEMTDDAKCGHSLFLQTLDAALEYAQSQRHRLEAAANARAEVTHGQ